jgi:hypothetical protein
VSPDPQDSYRKPLAAGHVACTRCHKHRAVGVHPCPWCRCPEYRLSPLDCGAGPTEDPIRRSTKKEATR